MPLCGRYYLKSSVAPETKSIFTFFNDTFLKFFHKVSVILARQCSKGILFAVQETTADSGKLESSGKLNVSKGLATLGLGTKLHSS